MQNVLIRGLSNSQSVHQLKKGALLKVHVTFVNPPYPPDAHQHPAFIPLGIGYLAAMLEKNDYSVNVIDAQALGLTYDEIENELRKQKPDIVGVTSTTLTYKSALRIFETAKKVNSDCLTLYGGCHATFWDEEALTECPQLDIVVRGEGENTLVELVKKKEAGKDCSKVVGTTSRKKGKIIKNPDRPYIENLDELPFPSRHLFPIERFRKYGKVIFPLTTSRGCVYWCDFCTAVRMFGRKYRMRSPKNVVDELEFLYKKYGEEQYTFYDDAFTVNQTRVEEICDEIIRRKLPIKWDCETRVDMFTKELLIKMKKAGCIALWLGVESGSQKTLDAMRKGITVEQTIRAFSWAREIGLLTVASVILGFPGETKETAWETIKLVEKIQPDDIGIYVATPYPGTPLYDNVKEQGLLKITDFNKYDTATPTFETPTMSMKELREIRDKAYQRFYLRPTHVLRMLSKGGVYGYSATRTSLAWLRRAIMSKLNPA
jgi:anaerobic magnesium-protoporphyrin IX monomethyl ester cyclase